VIWWLCKKVIIVLWYVYFIVILWLNDLMCISNIWDVFIYVLKNYSICDILIFYVNMCDYDLDDNDICFNDDIVVWL